VIRSQILVDRISVQAGNGGNFGGLDIKSKKPDQRLELGFSNF